MKEEIKRKKQLRMPYAAAFLILFLIEVLIARYIDDSFIRPYLGDVLVVIVIYCFLRIFIPTGITLLPLYIFLFAVGVELLQYIHIVELLHLENNRFFRILIGSVFDIKDIACYAAGCLILMLLHYIRIKLNRD